MNKRTATAGDLANAPGEYLHDSPFTDSPVSHSLTDPADAPTPARRDFIRDMVARGCRGESFSAADRDAVSAEPNGFPHMVT